MATVFHHYKTNVGSIVPVGNPLNAPFSLDAGNYSVDVHSNVGSPTVLQMQNLSGQWMPAHQSVTTATYKTTVSLASGQYRFATSNARDVFHATISQ